MSFRLHDTDITYTTLYLSDITCTTLYLLLSPFTLSHDLDTHYIHYMPLRRYTSNIDKRHWTALERVLRYLKGTIVYNLHYNRFSSVLEGYTDANWISDSVDVKSITGFVFLLGGGTVSWKSTKYVVMARSTMEVEMIALDTTSIEAKWLKIY